MTGIFVDGENNDRTRPPCGHAQFAGGSADDALPQLIDDFASLGALYRVEVPGRQNDSWIVADPQIIKRVLVANHGNYLLGPDFERIKMLVGNGIIVSEGETWKRQHRMLLPMFSRSQVQRLGPLIVEVNRRRLEKWSNLAASGEPFNVTRDTNENALEFILRATLGPDLDRLVARLGGNPFEMLTTESGRDLGFAIRFRQLRRHVGEIIAGRRAGPRPEPDVEPDWLGMLMAARDRRDRSPMSDTELIDEVMSLIVAGHETTGATLNALWYLLAMHPEVESALHAEVDGVELADLRLGSVEALRYTHQVILETLRLYPPVWILSRRCIHADRLGGYGAPAGTDLFLSPYLVQRNPEFWPDPDEFRPERFATGEAATGEAATVASDESADATGPDRSGAQRYAFIPFAAGPRHCVGETLAIYEMALHVYLAARQFRLRRASAAPMALTARINLRAREDVMMTVERRAPAR